MEKRKYVEVKFSDSEYAKTYQYSVPPHPSKRSKGW